MEILILLIFIGMVLIGIALVFIYKYIQDMNRINRCLNDSLDTIYSQNKRIASTLLDIQTNTNILLRCADKVLQKKHDCKNKNVHEAVKQIREYLSSGKCYIRWVYDDSEIIADRRMHKITVRHPIPTEADIRIKAILDDLGVFYTTCVDHKNCEYSYRIYENA